MTHNDLKYESEMLKASNAVYNFSIGEEERFKSFSFSLHLAFEVFKSKCFCNLNWPSKEKIKIKIPAVSIQGVQLITSALLLLSFGCKNP